MHQNEKHWNKTKGNRKKEMKEIHILFSFTCLRFFSATVNVFFWRLYAAETAKQNTGNFLREF